VHRAGFRCAGAGGRWFGLARERSHEGVTVIEDRAFAPAEWATLRFAPFWVLAAIAGRQSGFDPVEFDVFTQVVEEASARARGRFGGDLLQRVALDFDRLAAAFGNDRRSVVTGLFEVCRLLERLPPDEADAFREVLIRGVGEGMARARGRYGRIISEEDERTVELVGVLLS
jgi:hypothetical protein